MKRLLIFLGVALLASACDEPLAVHCVEKEKTLDVVRDGFQDYQRQRLDGLRATGWECSGEALYNAFGVRFGTRYQCTICE